jgi:hypothetical protein
MVVRETRAAVTNCQELRRLLSSRSMAARHGYAYRTIHDLGWPIIRIASIQQPPERIFIDTSQPTIVPPPTLVGDAVPGEPSPLQSYASTAPPPTVIDVDKKKRKGIKRQGPRFTAHQPPLASIPVATGGGSATTAPLTKLSFMDIISGMRRSLFKLN